MSVEELKKQIEESRKKISTDGFKISIGELNSMYRDKEIVINPDYQRYFRWNNNQKSRLIESILLGIPIPPIFVSQQDNGRWEVIDGLQRISTILQFMGSLLDSDGRSYENLVLEKTKLLPSLENVVWEKGAEELSLIELTQELKLFFKRSHVTVEIIKKESDPSSKYELFQRLNTLGSSLSSQEVRNCLLIMIKRPMYEWLHNLSQHSTYLSAINISEKSLEERYEMELVLRLFALKDEVFDAGWARKAVEETITDSMISIAANEGYRFQEQKDKFFKTFDYIAAKMEDKSFKRYNTQKSKFEGAFLVSAFECITLGVMDNIDEILSTTNYNLEERIKNLWSSAEFQAQMSHGVRPNARSQALVPFGKKHFKP